MAKDDARLRYAPTAYEMKAQRKNLSNGDEGQSHINYFLNNVDRMAYDTYRAMGFPIDRVGGGSSKLVVGKRFKGNGMRWIIHDNKTVLRTRLAELNDELEGFFTKKSRKYSPVAPEYKPSTHNSYTKLENIGIRIL